MKSHTLVFAGASVVFGMVSLAEVKIVADRSENPTASFKFKNVPAPSKNDAATKARFTIVDGMEDNNGGTIDRLHDGRVPTEDDQPSENFFFQAGTDGGRILVDLGGAIDIQQISRAKYDANYRITGNFLNWVTEKYAKDIVEKLNSAARGGNYNEDLWKNYTGRKVEELGAEWKEFHLNRLAAASPAASGESKINALTEEEKKAGWKLLFNGRDLESWHNFKTNSIRPGWQVKDGALTCADPHDAGDLCTKDQYDGFELQLDYNISEGGNSGIMYHVTDQGRTAWATGPEVQLEDNAKAADPQRCGWLYALYQPPIDPKTDKPLDATKPAGQWNHIRLLITPEKCEHEINGVKYFDYILGSEDFSQRVARSKFSRMPLFAKSHIGYLALQGDHGQVSFRNIKIRPIEAKK